MKIRAIKARLIRQARAVKTVATVTKTILFPVYRKKDNELIATVKSAAEAEALVLKAKTAKKASLYIGTPTAA